MDLRKWITTVIYALTILTLAKTDDNLDTREGVDLTLKCRFNEQQQQKDFTYYWARWTTSLKFENVAIGNIQLNSNYRIDYRPEKGIYDLQISNTSYGRDNGRFECRIKAIGTGADVHQQYYNLTVLTPPQPPIVAPGHIAVATEDKRLDLTCSSIGGSPDPTITWYREGSTTPLPAPTKRGGSKDLQTTSTLTIDPRKEDDSAKYKCSVWNRAMPEGQRLETTVTLSVNYYPRVEIGPENPLRVERDTTAKLECTVDAKPKVTNVKWVRNGRYISSSMVHQINRVSLQDAGKYMCSADNGLGKVGEQMLLLDVLYPPVVVIESKTREAEEGEPVTIRCNVTSNPPPHTIEWLKEGSPDFRYPGDILQITSVKASDAGTYVCRAINKIKPYNGKAAERVGNATVALLVRHRPGQAFINPSKPIVHVGNGVTLTCSANPPGWPVPQFRWFKDVEGETSTTQNILATGPQYVIPRAHLLSEGRYHCQATNELGHGEMGTIMLEVHQPPQFAAKLQQHTTKRVGDYNYSISCSAKGKPRPSVRWFKDNKDLSSEPSLYDIRTSSVDGPNGMITVQSTLMFHGKVRPNRNQLVPSDRGIYTCLYENEVNSANSSMFLRIEHGPIPLHQYNKVAYEIKENAEIVCKVQAYPKPEFQWQFGTNTAPLSMSSDGHYEISTTTDNSNSDVYISILRINNLRHQDYGDYFCRVANSLDSIRPGIRLQPKGKPERPYNLKAEDVGSNFVSLVWDPGFDGGIASTKFFVNYRKVPMIHNSEMNGDCGVVMPTSNEWMEYDCHKDVPCSITPLDQHQSYVFRVKSKNSMGDSEYSNEIGTTTKVSRIPMPTHVAFDPATKLLVVNVGATCLALMAVVESIGFNDSPLSSWQEVERIPLTVSGSKSTFREEILDNMISATRRSSARSLGDDDLPLALEEEIQPRVRVKLCLKVNKDHCGEYTEAEVGPAYIHDQALLATPTLIAIVVSCIVFALFVGLMLMFCRCKKSQKNKEEYTSQRLRNGQRPSIYCGTTEPSPTTLLSDHRARQQSSGTLDGLGVSNGRSKDVLICHTKWLRLSHNDGSDGTHNGRQRMTS